MRLQRAVDQFLSGYFATHERSLKTSRAYATDLEQFLAFVKRGSALDALTPDAVEAWARDLRQKDYQPTSIRRKLAALRALCNYWVRRNVLAASPFWRLRLNLGSARTLPRVLSADEVAALLREAARRARAHPAAARHGLGPGFLAVRDLAIVELLFATGVRVGELVGIRLDDLSLQERSILIRGKGRRQRLAFLTEPQSLQAVQQYVKLRTALPALLAPMAAPADPTAERSDPATARSEQPAASSDRTTANELGRGGIRAGCAAGEGTTAT
jgi:site-specific recombinase XerD